MKMEIEFKIAEALARLRGSYLLDKPYDVNFLHIDANGNELMFDVYDYESIIGRKIARITLNPTTPFSDLTYGEIYTMMVTKVRHCLREFNHNQNQ